MDLAKGVRYLAIAIMTSTLAYAPASADDKKMPEGLECTPTYCKRVEAPQSLSCEGLEDKVSSIEVTVSLTDYTLRLEGALPQEYGGRCTYIEQRAITGRKAEDRDWRTPEIESSIEYVIINPFWSPTKNILEELRKKHSDEWVAKMYMHEDGTYQRPGPTNPLGKAKFYFPNNHGVLVHGTLKSGHKLFDYEKREFSHGCIRIEDEVGFLKKLIELVGVEEECDEECVNEMIEKRTTKKLRFKKPIRISIKKGETE